MTFYTPEELARREQLRTEAAHRADIEIAVAHAGLRRAGEQLARATGDRDVADPTDAGGSAAALRALTDEVLELWERAGHLLPVRESTPADGDPICANRYTGIGLLCTEPPGHITGGCRE